MGWKLNNDRQIWMQLVEVLRMRIVTGRYPAGERMPSVRELAAEAGVNPNTMQRALSALEESMLVSAVRSTGRFVTQDEALIATAREKIAEEELDQFLIQMHQLGYDTDAIAQLIAKRRKKDE